LPVTGCGFIVSPSQRVMGASEASRSSTRSSYSISASRFSMVRISRRIGSGGGRSAPFTPKCLEVANPQHQLCDGGSARVDLDAEEVFRRDSPAGQIVEVLLVA